MQRRYGVIYKITNKKNQKVYIGISTEPRGFKDRYCASGEGIERVYNYSLIASKSNTYYNKHLFKSIKKYGVENFLVEEEFEVCYSKQELNERERYWILYYKSYDPNYGYNILLGGEQEHENIRLLNKKLLARVKDSFYYNRDIYTLSLGDILKRYNKSKKKKVEEQELREAWWHRKKNFFCICPICGRIIIKQFKKDLKKDMICFWCEEEKILVKCYYNEELRDYIEKTKLDIIEKLSTETQ